MSEEPQITSYDNAASAPDFVALFSRLLEIAMTDSSGPADCYALFRLIVRALDDTLPQEVRDQADTWLKGFDSAPDGTLGEIVQAVMGRRMPPFVLPQEKQQWLCDSAMRTLSVLTNPPRSAIDMLGALHIAERVVFKSFGDDLSSEHFEARMLFLAMKRGLARVNIEVDVLHVPPTGLVKGGDA